MADIDALAAHPLAPLATIPIGRLRRDALRRHGTCHFTVAPEGTLVPRRIDLHPVLLTYEDWHGYARFVLYH